MTPQPLNKLAREAAEQTTNDFPAQSIHTTAIEGLINNPTEWQPWRCAAANEDLMRLKAERAKMIEEILELRQSTADLTRQLEEVRAENARLRKLCGEAAELLECYHGENHIVKSACNTCQTVARLQSVAVNKEHI